MQRQSLLLTAPKRLEYVTENLPPLQPGEILIQTQTGAISIGAELPQYRGIARSSEPLHYPHMTGYESIGTVIECGAAVKHLHVGDRVVAFYGHRTLAIVPEKKAIPVPGGIADALALLTILSCDVTRGIRKVIRDETEIVLVTGAGTIGLLTVFMLKASGIHNVDVVEPGAGRRALALQLGARIAFSLDETDKIRDIYTVGFECSSRNAAFELLQNRMQREGRICILADGNLEPLVLAPAFHEKELHIVGSSDGWDYQEHAKWFFGIAAQYAHILEKLFDYSTTVDGLLDTFERLARGTIGPIKVLVKYY